MSKVRVAIHQPNFFPWLGYFYKIAASDCFVFLDNVNYPKSGSSMSSFCNRCVLLNNNSPVYITCPVKREHGFQLINEVEIKDREWGKEVLKNIFNTYSYYPYFSEIFLIIESIISKKHKNIFEINIDYIKTISEKLRFNTIFFKQSDLYKIEDKSSKLLVNIIKSLNGTDYIAGQGGSKVYLENNLFEQNFINVSFIKYPDFFKNFQTFINEKEIQLSSLHALMLYGFDITREKLYESL